MQDGSQTIRNREEEEMATMTGEKMPIEPERKKRSYSIHTARIRGHNMNTHSTKVLRN